MDRRPHYGKVEIPTWTLDKCWEIACDYKTRIEFQKGRKGAYGYALKHNLLDQLFPKNNTEETTHAIETETTL